MIEFLEKQLGALVNNYKIVSKKDTINNLDSSSIVSSEKSLRNILIAIVSTLLITKSNLFK